MAGKRSAKVTGAGGCLCGAVRYEARGPLRQVVNCHCGQCRRWHGHVAAYTNAAEADVTVAGKRHVKWYRSSGFARRGFCAKCGSSLFWRRDKSDTLSIAAGTLDGPTGLQTIRHIFVAHAGDYYKTADRLPKLPDGMA